MFLRVSSAHFIALSNFGKLRKSSTENEPYLNHIVRNQLNTNKLQKAHREVKVASTKNTPAVQMIAGAYSLPINGNLLDGIANNRLQLLS